MLLGRKLLKKVATRNDDVSRRKGSRMFCASSRSPHRHALARIIRKYRPMAATSQTADAERAMLHNRGASTREKRTTRSATLTPALRIVLASARRRGRGCAGPWLDNAAQDNLN
jgi:hypothetical protein